MSGNVTNWSYLTQTEFLLSSTAYVMIHVIPIVILQFISSKIRPGNIVTVRIRNLESVRVMCLFLREWMSEKTNATC